VGPELNEEFNLLHHKASINALDEIVRIDKEYEKITDRSYGGAVNGYMSDDAEYILISLGSISGIVREAVDRLRKTGIKAGSIKIRMMRPFPKNEIISLTQKALAIGVLDRDISFGYEGTVYTNVNSALLQNKRYIPSYNFIGGIGGRDISVDDIERCFKDMINAKKQEMVRFIGLEVEDDC
jgi:pyruvate ferredoxin oxidoreductase alpha subunit